MKERGFTLWCGFHTRDRSVTAGRSQLLSYSPSLYVLLDACQGIVGHREGDFDFSRYLSFHFSYVTNVPFRPSVIYSVAPNGIQAQAIED